MYPASHVLIETFHSILIYKEEAEIMNILLIINKSLRKKYNNKNILFLLANKIMLVGDRLNGGHTYTNLN